MALTAPKPRVRQTSTTTGTGTYSFDATIPDAHLGFVAEIGDTNTCHVLVTDSASNGWEWGTYTVTDASPDTLARTTVKRSTNSNAAVNWGAGTRTISVIWPPDVTEMLALLGVEAGAKDDQTASEIKTLLENGIDSVHYVDDSIDAAHYAAGSVDTTALGADAVTAAKIADDAIDSEHYAAGSIDTAHIADDQITLAKMAAGTDGVIITYDASGNPVHVGPGSDGEVLTSTGAGSPPAFEAAGGGAATKEFFYPVTYASGGATIIQSGNLGAGAATTSDNDRGHVTFIVPADFSSIDEMVFIVNPDVTNGASNWRIDGSYGAPGEAPDAHSGNVYTTYNVTEDVLFEADISGVFSSLAAGDLCGIILLQNGAGGDVTIFGVRFKY
jgi:hypothetical protein